ncbi:MAG: metallo-mystery pair system four-Cys motif protein [Gammaproteobacteria bacterium]|nr:metallo-mystery pair system four-Cys motif protein [Gammaproteobacteria bacterium]MCP5196680.1 metallo-mystery pair system four-Cys motif protein [Gammaproteobacteria bacterium]
MIDPRNRCSLPSLRSALMVGVMTTLAVGCGGDDDDDDNDSSPAVRHAAIQFQGQVNGQDFICGATYANVGVGQPGTYQVTDWRFYIHDVELVKVDGARRALDLDQDGVWQYENVALLDLRRDCGSGALPSNAEVAGAVSNENYTGICFKVGVPYTLNHINDATAPSPLNNSGMLWNWRGGRKFIRIDGMGAPGDGDNAVAFVVHLGSTECPGSDPNAPPTAACGYPNVAEFCLDGFDADQDRIIMNMGAALEASDVAFNTPDTASGCMSGNADPECITIMPRLNLDFTYVAGAEATPEQYPKIVPQRLFSVRKP